MEGPAANDDAAHALAARRILIYGVTGSGKTTLARRLADRIGLPWHAVDDLTWQPGWVSVPDEVQRERIQAICDGPAWILDSAYGKWLDIPLTRAELIVGLDYPRWVSLARLLRRTAGRVIDGRPVCNGNQETWRTTFSRDSIILWHFHSFAHKRQRMRQWAADPAGPPTILLRSARETEAWLATMEAPHTHGPEAAEGSRAGRAAPFVK